MSYLEFPKFEEIYKDIIEKNACIWIRMYVKILIKNGHEFIDCKKMSEDSKILNEFIEDIYCMYLFIKTKPDESDINNFISKMNTFMNKFPCFEVFATNEPIGLIDQFIYKKMFVFVQSNLI
jgi:hypothetical protein